MTRHSFDLTYIEPGLSRLQTDTATYVVHLAAVEDDGQFMGWLPRITQDEETWEGDAFVLPTSHGALWEAIGTILDTEEDRRAEREG